MNSFDFEPKYSTSQIPGKCIKCLAEQELDSCLLELLREETDNQELQQRYERLVSFLKSPESQKLRDESENLLAEGRQVTLRVRFEHDKPSYELKVD